MTKLMSTPPGAPPEPPGSLLPESNPPKAPRRRTRQRFVILVCSLLSVALVAGIFVASFAYNWWLDNHTPQVTTPVTAVAPANLAAYRAFAADAPAVPPAPIVLSFHDLAPGPGNGRYTVTPDNFEAQMRMLSEAGYRSITTAQFVAYTKGTWQPSSRTVLITFDDGTSGLWVYADKILQRYHFRATAFLITGSVGTNRPYYLTWRHTQKMSASGRWDFGSHTNALHVRAATGADGVDRPVLTNRLNLGGHRVETMAAFEARVRNDLARSKTEMTTHGLPSPQLFAWPFSSLVHKATDPAAAQFARALVRTSFAASFSNPANNPQPAARRDIATGMVERLEVMDTTSAHQLFGEMADMQTLPPSAAPDPLGTTADWASPTSEKATIAAHGGVLSIAAPQPRYVEFDWAPQRTADWDDYTATVTVSGLDAAGGVTGGLRVRVGSPAEIALRVSAATAALQNAAGETLRTFTVLPAARHTLALAVGNAGTTASVNGTALATIPVTPGPDSTGGPGIVASRATTVARLATFDDLHVSVP